MRGAAATIGVLALAAGSAGAADWVNTGGPVGGLGYDVRIHPTSKQTMYVTDNYAGVVKSINGGRSWFAANSGINVRGGPTADAFTIFSLTVDPNSPNIAWAGTNGANRAFGVFKSVDGGATWQAKNTGISDNGFGIVFRGFTIQPGNSSVVYAQAELPTDVQGREFNRVQGRVYKSTNGGDSWSLIWSGENLARHLIIDPSDASILYLSTGIFDREASNSDCATGVGGAGGVGILKSTNGGATWSAVNNGLADLYVGALRMHPTNSQILYAATGNNACSGAYEEAMVSGLFRTTNGGASWTKLLGNDIFTTVGFGPSNPNIVYAGTASAFFRSGDGGATWARYSKPSGAEWGPPGIRAGVPIDVTVDPDDPNVVYANNYGGGVFRSTDGAQSWQVWSRGYSGAEVHSLAAVDAPAGTVYAVGRSGPFRTPNFGLEWVGIGNGAANFAEWYAIAAQPNNPSVVLLTDEHQGVILRSDDAGADFTLVLRHPDTDASLPSKRQGFKSIAFAPSNPMVVYVGLAKDRTTVHSSTPVGGALYKSTNGGVSFTSPTAALDGKNIHRLAVDRANANTVWAATSTGVYKSTDGGANWGLLGLSGQNVLSVAVDPNNSNALVASVRDVGIFVSSDGGETWPGGPFNTGLNNANPSVVALVFDPSVAGRVYAADYYSGVYRSTDGGQNWSAFPDGSMTGLGTKAVKDLAWVGGVLYAATQGGGVFRNGGPSILPTPAQLTFPPTERGATSAPRTVTVVNAGPAARQLSGNSLGGTHGSDFRIENDTCAASLSSAVQCTFDVRFAPSGVGSRSGSAIIASDDPFASTVSVALNGQGLEPPDAGVDAGTEGDAGTPGVDGETPEPPQRKGCGCSGAGGELALFMLLLVAARSIAATRRGGWTKPRRGRTIT